MLEYSIMNNKRTKKLHKIIIGQLSVAFIMFALAISILFFAEGYRINLKNLKITKTGILFLYSDPKNAEVLLNGKKQKNITPFSINLTPGNYKAEVKAEGYISWASSFKIESGLVTNFNSIVLFKEHPEINNLTDQRKIDQINAPIDVFAVTTTQNVLTQNGYEIWLDDKLVTRFSEPISNVKWYPDLKHIVFQQGDEIRVIETTGMNDTLLIKSSLSERINYAISGRGDELYYLENNQYKVAKIR